MSNHHSHEFLGFGASAPPNVIPDWLFMFLFFPPVRTTKEGIPIEAPYGLRKIEAVLMEKGFDVLTVDPDHLKPHLEDAKILAIHVMDPFGWGPSSSTFSRILRSGEPYLAKYFRLLLEKPEVREAKKRGLKIVVGGPGVWQFKYDQKFLKDHGIDVVILGEGEKIVPKVMEDLLSGKSLPQFIGSDGLDEQAIKQSPSIEEIPEIKNPSVNGLVEIGRGCPRHCKFCSVTLRPLRWYPYEKIEKEIKVNVRAGIKGGILHAEDVLLYGSKNWIPKPEKVIKLQKLAKKYYKTISWSHASFAAVAANPKLIKECSEIICDGNQSWWGVEMGIETASYKLLCKTMRGKVLPFKPEEWYDVLIQAAGIMNDNNLVPACTLITGLPGETDEDVIKTIELIDDLKWFKSLIVPLFFVPMGQLRNLDWFKLEDLTELQKELMIKCLRHDIYWTRKFAFEYLNGRKKLLLPLYFFFIWCLERVGRKRKILA